MRPSKALTIKKHEVQLRVYRVKKENKELAVSDMLLKLLKTQEEQALYIVQLHEQNDLLKKQIELLSKK